MHFQKSGRFFKVTENVVKIEQGAGELGPLGFFERVFFITSK